MKAIPEELLIFGEKAGWRRKWERTFILVVDEKRALRIGVGLFMIYLF